MKSNSGFFGVAMAAICVVGSATADYAVFADPLDTIRISGDTVVSEAITIEAVLILSDASGLGRVYTEHNEGLEDKQLRVRPQVVDGFAYPRGLPSTLRADLCMPIGRPVHVAFVSDGVEERIYVGGTLAASRGASGLIGNASTSSQAHVVGAVKRSDIPFPLNSFVGAIDTLRVSSDAIYVGTEFDAPADDLTATESTVLLYNFNELPGATTVADESGNGLHGDVGVGFDGATAPEFTADPIALIPMGACQTDFDRDGQTGFSDLVAILAAWGEPQCPGVGFDVQNADGVVGFDDLLVVLSSWGPC